MKKKFTGILSILLAFSLIFSLAACGKDKKDEEETTTSVETTVSDENTMPDETTEMPSDETTTQLTDETGTAPSGETASNTDATTANPSSAPKTVAEIVAYYNAAANKAKKEKPAYTLVTTNIIGDITSSSSLLEGIAKRVVPMFSEDLIPTTVNVKKGDGSSLPVKDQNYGAKVEASSLTAKNGAICIDKGSYYEITLNFKPEKLNSLPVDVTKIRHGQAFNMLTQKLVDDETDRFKAIVKIVKFAPEYHDCYVKCKIEKATGNILSGTYECVNNSDVEAKIGFTTFDVNIFFGNREEFTFKY